MKVVCAIVLFIFIAKASPGSPRKQTLKSIPAVDSLIQRLEGEKWTVEDEACFKDTLRILYGVQNDTLWATWIWDSMQLPVGLFYGSGFSFGNFDQCIRSPWTEELSTQYCLVEVQVQDTKKTRQFEAYDSATEYMNTYTNQNRSLNHFAVGMCMPAVCSPSSVAKFTRHTLKMTHIPDPKTIVVTPTACQTAEPEPYQNKFYIYIAILGVLASLIVVSTIYSIFNENSEYSNIDEIAKSLSVVHNWNALFKVNKNEIKILSGIRVLSSLIVIGCHQALFSLHTPPLTYNGVEVDVAFKGEILDGISHLDLVVDTFFVISGLLLIRGLLSGRQGNLLIVLVKRYIRLIGPYAVTTFYLLCASRYIGSGPMWADAISNEEKICEKYWWKNILMMNFDMRTMCYGVAWYVTCDFHLAILTVVLFWIYRRNNKVGMVAVVATGCFLTVRLAVTAYIKQWPVNLFLYVSDIANVRYYYLMSDLYIHWHYRAGSYLTGVVMAWLMNIYKPEDHRNVISKTKSFSIAMVALFIMMKVASINYWSAGASRAQAAVALATHRTVWSMAVCVLIAACEYGSVPILSDFLSSGLAVPLSKLTYGIYLTHYLFLQRHIYVARTSIYFDKFNASVSTAGIFLFSCLGATVLHLLVEAPFINISNFCFSGRKVKVDCNGNKSENGSIHNGMNKTKEKAS